MTDTSRHPDAQRVMDDLVQFGVGPDDLRVARGDWVYYVKAVPRGRWFLGTGGGGSGAGSLIGADPGLGADPGGMVVGLLLAVPVLFVRRLVAAPDRRRRSRGRAMKVGVVRVPNPAGWKVARPRVVHKEVLARGEDPVPRLEALADRAQSGEFAPPQA